MSNVCQPLPARLGAGESIIPRPHGKPRAHPERTAMHAVARAHAPLTQSSLSYLSLLALMS